MEKVSCKRCGAENPSNSKYCSRCGFELPKPVVENVKDIVVPQKTEVKPQWGKLLGMAVGAIAFAVAYWGAQQLFFKPPSIDKLLMATASELNKTCPMMIDQGTRLDNAVALPENILLYNYTLIDFDKSELNADTMKKYMEPAIINNVKTDPGMKNFRDNKVTLDYNYRDKNGVFVLKISVTPALYE